MLLNNRIIPVRSRGDGFVRPFPRQNTKNYKSAALNVSDRIRKPLGTDSLFRVSDRVAPGGSFARLQTGISSKSRIIGGGRFDYNAPTQGYFYGER